MIPLHSKLNCSASLKSPEKFDHSFFSNYTGHWHDKRIREQTYNLNPSKMDKNGIAFFFLPPFIFNIFMKSKNIYLNKFASMIITYAHLK